MTLQPLDGSTKHVRIIIEVPQADVVLPAEDAPDLSGLVVMIDVKVSERSADAAASSK